MSSEEPRPARAQRASYRSLASFYHADPRRASSRELDVGLWWRDSADETLHRAAWILDTGELYIARLGPAAEGGGRVEVLATVRERQQLLRILEGWRERCGRPRSLEWLRARAAQRWRGARSARPSLATS